MKEFNSSRLLFIYRTTLVLSWLILFQAALPGTICAQVSILTQHNNNYRNGLNSAETILTPSNVNANQFGKLFTYALDDQTYSQPLYVPGLTMKIDSQKHNVVFVTSVNNSVYAWDADSNVTNGGKPLWHVNLTPAGGRPPNIVDMDKIGACGGTYHDFAGNFGIVGTPAIDAQRNAMYLVARTVENGNFIQRLYALDIRSGANIVTPKIISASYSNISCNTPIQFNPQLQNQRSALTLVNGVVYIAWSSHCDNGDYHGWVIGYRQSDLQQVTAWNDSPADDNGENRAGIWQGGQGATVDDLGYLYFLTGNGAWDGANNFGESALQLTPVTNGNLRVGQYFTPFNYAELNNHDNDLGSSGMVRLPASGNRTFMVGGGKQGKVYVMDTAAMGGYTNGGPDKVVQEFQATSIQNGGTTLHIHGGPVFLPLAADAGYLYLWGENDWLRVFKYTSNASAPFDSTAVATSTVLAPQISNGMPGGFLSLSGNKGTNSILWALAPHACNANQHVEPGRLFAFDATNFETSGGKQKLKILWDSGINLTRDDVGYFAKFTYPTVANGKVYVAGWGAVPAANEDKCSEDVSPGPPANKGMLSVYGLLHSRAE